MRDLIIREDAIKAACKGFCHPGAFCPDNYCYEETKYLMELPAVQPEIIRCKDCAFSHMTYDGDCKYCDIWFPYDAKYLPGDYFCGSAERRKDG